MLEAVFMTYRPDLDRLLFKAGSTYFPADGSCQGALPDYVGIPQNMIKHVISCGTLRKASAKLQLIRRGFLEHLDFMYSNQDVVN